MVGHTLQYDFSIAFGVSLHDVVLPYLLFAQKMARLIGDNFFSGDAVTSAEALAGNVS